jgi:hypothetical protein
LRRVRAERLIDYGLFLGGGLRNDQCSTINAQCSGERRECRTEEQAIFNVEGLEQRSLLIMGFSLVDEIGIKGFRDLRVQVLKPPTYIDGQ